MKYIVTTYLRPRGEEPIKLYHCGEPHRPSKYETVGGFDFKIAGAITYDNEDEAKKTRNRIQKYYPDFPMHVSAFEDKEIFVGLLKGTIQ